MANHNEKLLMELLRIEGNQICADCRSTGNLKRNFSSSCEIALFFVNKP